MIFKKGYLSLNGKVIGKIKNMDFGIDNNLNNIQITIPKNRIYTATFTIKPENKILKFLKSIWRWIIE